MPVSLGFRKEELPALKAFLQGFEQLALHPYEELRCRIGNSVVVLFSSGKLLIQGTDAVQIKEKILASVSSGNELILGIDEAGRGENFGLFCIAGVLGKTSALRELRDSKKTRNLAEKKKIVLEKCVSSVVIAFAPETIDVLRNSGKNLNQMEADAIEKIIRFVSDAGFLPEKIVVDGNPLPVKTKGIVFLPKADDLEPVVGAASVLAKSAREESGNRTKRLSWKSKIG